MHSYSKCSRSLHFNGKLSGIFPISKVRPWKDQYIIKFALPGWTINCNKTVNRTQWYSIVIIPSSSCVLVVSSIIPRNGRQRSDPSRLKGPALFSTLYSARGSGGTTSEHGRGQGGNINSNSTNHTWDAQTRLRVPQGDTWFVRRNYENYG